MNDPGPRPIRRGRLRGASRRRALCGPLLWTLLGCPGPDGETPEPLDDLPGTAVWFEPGADLTRPETFYRVPWPDDRRRGPDLLSGLPRPTDHPATDQLLSLVEDATGFSTVPVVRFVFDGGVAPVHPDDGPVAPERALLVDLDAGRGLPVVAQTLTPDAYTPEHTLALTPFPGVVLDPGARHGVVVWRDWGDEEGARLGTPGPMRDALRGVPADDPLADLGDWLVSEGYDLDGVAAATVFTTRDVVAETQARIDAVRSRHAPELRDLAVTPDDGADHPRFCELSATVALPQFQAGEPPFDTGGRFVVDGSGALVTQRTDIAPVTLAIPRTPMPPGGYPVVFYAHGTNGEAAQVVDRGPIVEVDGEPTPGLGPAHVLARHGLASAGLATLLSPQRLGFERPRAYLNLLNLAAYRDTWRQGLLDASLFFDALRAVEIPVELLEDCGEGVPTDGPVTFAVDPLMLMGQSAGAHLSTMLAATEPEVAAVAPTGSGGFWNLLLAGGSRVGGPPELFAFALQTEAELSILHPGLALLQWAWEPAEPMVYAAAYERLRGPSSPIHLYVPFGEDDGYFPNPVFEAMAVAYGVERAGPAAWEGLDEALAVVGRDPLGTAWPIADNRPGAPPHTAVTTTWPGDGLTDPHGVFAQYDEIKLQYGCFFATWVATGTARVVAPGAEDGPCGIGD